MESKVLIRRVLLTIAVCIAGRVPGTADAVFWASPTDGVAAAAEKIVASMSNSELIGQVLMLGYLGIEPTNAFLKWVKEWGIGGVKVFGWNTGDLPRLAGGIARLG